MISFRGFTRCILKEYELSCNHPLPQIKYPTKIPTNRYSNTIIHSCISSLYMTRLFLTVSH